MLERSSIAYPSDGAYQTLVEVLRICGHIFEVQSLSKLPTQKKLNYDSVFKLAKKNNILLPVCQIYRAEGYKGLNDDDIQFAESTISAAVDFQKKIKESLQFLKRTLGNKFIVHKTYRAHDRIPNDIDFIAEDFNEARHIIESNIGLPGHVDFRVPDAQFVYEGVVKLHLHGRVGWHGKRYLDDEIYFCDVVERPFCGLDMPIPGPNCDLLIHLAHMVFEPLHFTASDLFYVSKLKKSADLSYCEDQAKNYNWGYAFRGALQHLKTFEDAFTSSILDAEFLYDKKNGLPYTFPNQLLIKSFLLKGIWLEPIKKLHKVARVLISNNSYDRFYTPPEEQLDQTNERQ